MIKRLLVSGAFVVSASAAFAQTDTQSSDMAASPAMLNVNAPITRAQVRADLARARADGTIPAFGNPDPYGPARSARNAPNAYPGR